ncbi:MAG TPA: hypothetical protein VGE07_23575 [Herpetosiphonaceae bacterium]
MIPARRRRPGRRLQRFNPFGSLDTTAGQVPERYARLKRQADEAAARQAWRYN